MTGLEAIAQKLQESKIQVLEDILGIFIKECIKDFFNKNKDMRDNIHIILDSYIKINGIASLSSNFLMDITGVKKGK